MGTLATTGLGASGFAGSTGFGGATFTATGFGGAALGAVALAGADLTGAGFEATGFAGTIFGATCFAGADLAGAALETTAFAGAVFGATVFETADFDAALCTGTLGAGLFEGDFPVAADLVATGLVGALATGADFTALAGADFGFAVAFATLRAAGLGALFLLATALEAFALLLLVAIAAPSVPELIHVHAFSQGALKPTPVSICNGWFRS